VNILESLEILRRIGIDAYIYFGLSVLPDSLYNIYASGPESGVVVGRKHLTLWTRNLVKKLLDLPVITSLCLPISLIDILK
jgi:hypothetical protein